MTKKQEIRANRIAWIKALESGKYAQTEYCLRDARGFCCLGVFCDVVEPDGWSKEKYMGMLMKNAISHKRSVSLLSQRMREMIDLSDYHMDRVVEMNDNGSTFADIAIYLRELWKL